MSRKRRASHRSIIPDAKYEDVIAASFINVIMRRGKKSLAESIFYGMLDIIEKKGEKEPLKFFKRAIDSVRPAVEVRSRRVGGASYQVPVEISPRKGRALAMRWIAASAKARKGKGMQERLASEIMDAVKGDGASVKKRENVHKMAEANKAFAHFRW